MFIDGNMSLCYQIGMKSSLRKISRSRVCQGECWTINSLTFSTYQESLEIIMTGPTRRWHSSGDMHFPLANENNRSVDFIPRQWRSTQLELFVYNIDRNPMSKELVSRIVFRRNYISITILGSKIPIAHYVFLKTIWTRSWPERCSKPDNKSSGKIWRQKKKNRYLKIKQSECVSLLTAIPILFF